MGAGAWALRRNMGQYDSIERHVRLNRHAWMGTNAPWTIITISGIPAVEIEVLEAIDSSDDYISIDYDDDYDYGVMDDVSDTEHWLANAGVDSDTD